MHIFLYIHTRWSWVFSERTQILSGIQFTRHFIEFIVVETKQFVGSNVNVILTRQTCGKRPSMAAEANTERALGNDFPNEFAMCSKHQNVDETEI